MNISGNTIFIAGATSGIGLALAQRFQQAGNTVIIGGRRTDTLERLAAGHGFDTVVIDTTDPASVLLARDQVLAAHPDLNVIVAMAGIMIPEDVTSAAFLESAERTVETNVLGPLRLISAFIEHLRNRPDATIVTVSSGLAHTPLRITPSYNGSKAFIHLYSESIRLQLANTNVNVIELCPPAVQTELIPGGSQAEAFMPLEDYIDDTMSILRDQPDVTEVIVDRVKPLRFSEVYDKYDETIAFLNSH
jgi:short-subunit dehydrogenase involved in D-alanine esterification of teichoic acids